MKMKSIRHFKKMMGFTLIEMLLVMVIVSMIVVMGSNYLQQKTLQMRIDRATNQIQQVLNAALAYYVVNGFWPADLKTLQMGGAYLPQNIKLLSPWNTAYVVVPSPASPSSLVYVYFQVTYATSSESAAAVANMIAGRLPLSYVTATAPSAGSPPPDDGKCKIGSSNTSCYAVAAVNVPGQNLNNATAVNYAGVYHSGSCVPVPTCPVDQNGLPMTPQIMVVPASVSGVNDPPDPSGIPCEAKNLSGCKIKVYPISSFTASATGPMVATSSSGPPSCFDPNVNTFCLAESNGNKITSSGSEKYWRVCLSAITEKGPVNTSTQPNTIPWGQLEGTVMVITRCAPQNEDTGSSFNVWSR